MSKKKNAAGQESIFGVGSSIKGALDDSAMASKALAYTWGLALQREFRDLGIPMADEGVKEFGSELEESRTEPLSLSARIQKGRDAPG